MTGTQTLLARIALGVVGAVASVALCSWRRLRRMPDRQFDRVLFASFAGSRLGLFSLVFLVFRVAPRGDVLGYYFVQAEQVLGHLVPYRDFVSSYAPLHAYFDAALIWGWHTPLAIMLFSVAAELALLPLWMRAGREFLPEGDLRGAALLYLASPVSLQFVALDGQDNVVIAVLMALALWMILRSRVFAAGVAFGTSLAAIKFLPLLYGPAFLLATVRRWRFMLGTLAVVAVVFGGFAMRHVPVLKPLAAEGDLWSAGDLPYLVEGVLGVAIPPRLSDAILAVALLAIVALMARACHGASKGERMRAFSYGSAALTLALLALSKKSWPPYLMLALFPICVVVASGGSKKRGRVAVMGFAIFNVVAITEHSYWASSLHQFTSAEFHERLMRHEVGAYILLGLEVALIGGYLGLLFGAIRRLGPAAK